MFFTSVLRLRVLGAYCRLPPLVLIVEDMVTLLAHDVFDVPERLMNQMVGVIIRIWFSNCRREHHHDAPSVSFAPIYQRGPGLGVWNEKNVDNERFSIRQVMVNQGRLACLVANAVARIRG